MSLRKDLKRLFALFLIPRWISESRGLYDAYLVREGAHEEIARRKIDAERKQNRNRPASSQR